jgi:hypothetical protein
MRRIAVVAVITSLTATITFVASPHVPSAQGDRLECKRPPGVPGRLFPGMPAIPGDGCPPGFG